MNHNSCFIMKVVAATAMVSDTEASKFVGYKQIYENRASTTDVREPPCVTGTILPEIEVTKLEEVPPGQAASKIIPIVIKSGGSKRYTRPKATKGNKII